LFFLSIIEIEYKLLLFRFQYSIKLRSSFVFPSIQEKETMR